MPGTDRSGLLDLFVNALPESFFAQLHEEFKIPVRVRIFTLPLVMWLMISQRLDPKGTLSSAVQQVVQRRPRVLLSDHKRIREDKVSCSTTAYCDARHELPLKLIEKVADRVVDQLTLHRPQALPDWDRRVLVLDGTAVEAQHTPELVEAYPPAPNQYGASHWTVLKMVVADELTTGLIERPCWGPMYGPKPVSEQALAERIMSQLPAASVVMADINFGVFSVAYSTGQEGHDSLFRLQQRRALAMGRGLPMRPGTDAPFCWRPSRADRKSHPDLPADACVRGRLIYVRITSSNGASTDLYFFTTLDLPVEKILQLYGKRWNIETDFRSLKETLQLEILTSKSVEMVSKELILAIGAWNLVRAVMNAAATQYNLDPKRLSFSRCQDVVNAALPGLDAAPTTDEYQARLRRMLKLVASCKLPDRSGRPSYPRAVWGHSCKFPKRKAPPQEKQEEVRK